MVLEAEHKATDVQGFWDVCDAMWTVYHPARRTFILAYTQAVWDMITLGTVPIAQGKQVECFLHEWSHLSCFSPPDAIPSPFCCLVSRVWLLCDPMDYSLPGSSVHGISQVIIMEWVAISFSKGSSQPRDRTQVSYTGRWILYHWATREAHTFLYCLIILIPPPKAATEVSFQFIPRSILTTKLSALKTEYGL